ncbi:hypothetical protein DCC39_12400 [Pueribacillus theae]|uniref:Uncharacterized protein n=1 Tax=Pueribacillus theae TaxID=2171751 RepID=A0A2U1JY75_9BACI|nr:hypothetical protein [Pueribacillus theae]PWA09758.1 hypothetical protein DCC39_12400 [Pueribacillus theae]
MDKEKFRIPMPDEQTIQSEIERIVAVGVKPRQSFLSYLVMMYRGIGVKYLFTNQRDGILITFSIMAILVFLFSQISEKAWVQETEVYSFLFLVSPLLYISLSVYDFLHKRHNQTFEVEMVSTYNLYQVAAFRMLVFSIISILVNTISIISLIMMYENLHFIRAFMVSTTALFLFSIIFLAALMKRQSGIVTILVIAGWIGTNRALSIPRNQIYAEFLLHLPVFVYGVVLIVSILVYLNYLSKLMRFKPTEGV